MGTRIVTCHPAKVTFPPCGCVYICLIYVLFSYMFGFMQKEVVAALPKLIKLNPVVVKEVFNRLLGVQSEFNQCVLCTL